ncbi:MULTISPECIES: ASCH domain-containing protein [Brachyspira]|uniref:ASCH domain-containing protein n=1 Tax=Brachyspira suanatina TaxID=381802 RepID=A0A0G4K9N0_9SPIR|nr:MULTISPECIES: ASCH domain-containing protein [Brachyspira]KLI32030.1 hypothetical protein SZ49_02330 [Brachyspira hyodysenteriae]CRF34526.1 hypothetical protein BRSU_2076 [Brachyspira suanatina]
MKVLLSIKPEYVEKIFNGSKKYEIRKSIFKRKNIKKIIIYSSSPISKVVGEFEIEDIISDDLDNVWNIIKYESGVSVDFFYKYLENKEIAYAIKIGKIKKYRKPKKLEDFNIFYAPQSFVYL